MIQNSDIKEIVGKRCLVAVPENEFITESGIILKKDPDLSNRYERGEVLMISVASDMQVGDIVLYDKVNLTECPVTVHDRKCWFLDDSLVILIENRDHEDNS